MRDEFQRSLHSLVAASPSVEKDPVEGDITAPCSTSPPRVLHSYQQHAADYVCLFMEEGEELTLGEDPAAPWIVEVFLSILFYLSIYCIPSISGLTQSLSPNHQKHGRDAHNVQIVASTTHLQGFADPEEEIYIPPYIIICSLLSLLQYSFKKAFNILLIIHFALLHFAVPNWHVSVLDPTWISNKDFISCNICQIIQKIINTIIQNE